ncbi:MAG: hypothetical protein KR126chlam1_00924 [Chlamydiae bacterium]|nr:hypothetical protein [Chlamydiota bacterium]
MHFEFPEGATPLSDCSDLLIPWVQNMRDLNRVEAENISEAQRKHLRPSSDLSSWFHYQGLRVIHLSMFGKVWAWAGKQRKSITSIGVMPSLIPLQIAVLCEEVISWSTKPIELTFLEKSARIHHRLVYIHPFENGNGRFARLVADKCLLSWNCPHPIWPDDLHREGVVRKRYIQTLKSADKGNIEPLIELMKEFGAMDPDLSMLFEENSFKIHLENSKSLAKIRALIRKGKDPNQISGKGHHPLQLIIRSRLDNRRKLELLKLLVEHGAKVDQMDKSGLTPLQAAIDFGDEKIAFFLRSKKNP